MKKFNRNKGNKYIVIGRAMQSGNSTKLILSIGTYICELLDFEFGGHVLPFLSKKNRNLIMVKKCESESGNYRTLCYREASSANFCRLHLTMNDFNDFKLSQTIQLDYDFDDEKRLFINVEKLRWKK